MNQSAASHRASELHLQLNDHNHNYYILAQPTITDREYDDLLNELIALERDHPSLATPDSPTQKIGGEPLETFESVVHPIPMLSLSNTYSKQEVADFDQRITKLLAQTTHDYVLEPKIDGVAISLHYEHGILIRACTRGNGHSGDDITQNVKTIRSIPLRLRTPTPPNFIEIRGEVYMPTEGFQALNLTRLDAGEDAFKNPRNATAGSLKMLDSSIVATRPLDVVLYAVGKVDGTTFESHTALLAALSEYGCRTPPKTWVSSDIQGIIEGLDALQAMRDEFPFQIDGGVIKVNDRSLYDRLGYTAKSPRWAVAYKYEPEQAETILHAITIQVGRTGVLTPVAELDPVDLAGTTVSRATLHNEEEIHRKDIRVGDTVIVEKAGDIIPAIVRVVLEKRSGNETAFNLPDNCPVCDTPVVRTETEVAVRCDNLHCPAQIKSWIRHFASRNAMDIDGLGDTLVDQLVDLELIQTPADLYTLRIEKLATLDRMAEKSAHNVISGVDKSRQQPFWKFLFALGIRHVGAGSARRLADHYLSLEALMAADQASLEAIDDIGPIVAASIRAYFADPTALAIVQSLQTSGVQTTQPPPENKETLPLNGLSFVLTGTLPDMTRGEAGEKLIKMGAKISSSISKNTHFLVAGESAGSKLIKAEKLGVPIIDAPALSQLLESGQLPETPHP